MREEVEDANLMDEAGFHNVTAPSLVLPIRPVNKVKKIDLHLYNSYVT